MFIYVFIFTNAPFISITIIINRYILPFKSLESPVNEWSFKLLGCRKSSLQIVVILYEGFAKKSIVFLQNTVQLKGQNETKIHLSNS